jgi:hypothetical protein
MGLVEIGWGAVDRVGLVESSYERGNELPGSIKCWETIDRLHNR